MSTCLGISRGAAFDCNDKPQAGVDETLVLINLDDIDTMPEDSDQVVTDITLKAGKLAYAFEGTRNSLVPSSNFVKDGSSSGYEHMAQFIVFDKTQVSRNNIEKLGDKQVLALIENKDGTFEILGKSVGLLTSENTRNNSDRPTAGGFQITIKTDEDGAFEAKLPQILDAGSAALTAALIDNLQNLPSVTNVSPNVVAIAGGTAVTITGDNFFKNAADDVTSVDWIDSLDAVTNEPGYVTDSNSQISIASSVALIAGTYKVRITTTSGIAESGLIVTAS
jgi:hypothetical protein